VIYYSGLHPYTLEPIYTPKSESDRELQHKFFFWYKPENRAWIKDTLRKAGREDLSERLLDAPQSKNQERSAKGKPSGSNSTKPRKGGKKPSGLRLGKSRPGKEDSNKKARRP
jgi:hypothetical protein